MKVSNCCGATLLPETDICSDCKEHSEAVEYDVKEVLGDPAPFLNLSAYKSVIKNINGKVTKHELK